MLSNHTKSARYGKIEVRKSGGKGQKQIEARRSGGEGRKPCGWRHNRGEDLYKYPSKQISFSESIPWKEIEQRYAALFTNKKGNVAKPLRLALGACIIQAEYGYSDEEVRLQIQEGPYLQFFCGFGEYKDEPPFDASLMVYFRKRLTPEILGEINELIILRAQEQEETAADNNTDDDDPENGGTLIVDATCAPSDIRYPTDTSLLDEARRNSEKIIDMLHQLGNGEKPRTYRRRAHKEYVQFVRTRKPGQKKIRRCIKKQLGYLDRNLGSIERMLAAGGSLPARWQERLQTLRTVYEQQLHKSVQT